MTPLAVSRNAAAPRLRRRAFTLVEVLLALGLTMLVLAAAYSGLILFQNVTVAGRIDAQRSQLARAIERRMTADIRCVLFREAEPVEEEDDEPAVNLVQQSNTSASNDPETLTQETTTEPAEPLAPATPEEAYATQTVGIFGNATTLVLHLDKPARETTLPAPTTSDVAAPPARRSDLRSIAYFLAVPGGAGFQGAVGNAAGGVNSLNRGNQGLARLDGDRLTIGQADAAGATDLLGQDAAIVAGEVTELGFRYFDGATWLTEWDSVTLNALPRAIEVTLRIDVDRSDEPTNAFETPPPPSASDLYRFVVALPLADPTLGLAL